MHLTGWDPGYARLCQRAHNRAHNRGFEASGRGKTSLGYGVMHIPHCVQSRIGGSERIAVTGFWERIERIRGERRFALFPALMPPPPVHLVVKHSFDLRPLNAREPFEELGNCRSIAQILE